MSDSGDSITYRDAGVDIDAGDAFVELIKPVARSTRREGCISALGGFGAMFEIPDGYRQPVLVSGTDGVGTKLKLAFELDKHDTVGIDLVAMCANDILVQGAEPLFFLDYFATGKLSPQTASAVVAGIGEGCRQAGAALIGGETAEMPGMYAEGEYDLAGFCVGAVEKTEIVDGSRVAEGDILIGLTSSGAHSNGFSLIRKIVDTRNVSLGLDIDGRTLGERLLEPTRIYVKSLLPLLKSVPVHALAHITGGGLPGNLARVIPDHCHAVVERSSWRWPSLFDWLMETGNVARDEMLRTFNCGIGMVLVIPAEHAGAAEQQLTDLGETPHRLGRVVSGPAQPQVQIV